MKPLQKLPFSIHQLIFFTMLFFLPQIVIYELEDQYGESEN